MAPLVSKPLQIYLLLRGSRWPLHHRSETEPFPGPEGTSRSQALCFAGTGPIHSPLIKHLLPPVATRKNPTVKANSQLLEDCHCLSFLSCKKSLFVSMRHPAFSLLRADHVHKSLTSTEPFIKEPISEKVTDSKFKKTDSPACKM